MSERLISIVIPVFNEEENLSELYRRISQMAETLDSDYEVIVVNDGSVDSTLEQLCGIHQRDPHWRVISFSRNFGHQTAVSAGLHYSRGDAVAVMDGDLQDPPEILPDMLARLDEGYQVVYAVRRQRKEGLVKRTAYGAFYRLLKRLASIEIPLDSGDFSVMDRSVVEVLRAMPERTRFVRGLRSWAGFRQCGFEYERHARHDGDPKYTWSGLVRLAADGILSFSSSPLRLASWLGILFCCGALGLTSLLIVWWLSDLRLFGAHPGDMVGWTSLTALILAVAGLQMLMIGVVGEYLARVFEEVKQRPAWIVSYALGFEEHVEPTPVFPNVTGASVTGATVPGAP